MEPGIVIIDQMKERSIPAVTFLQNSIAYGKLGNGIDYEYDREKVLPYVNVKNIRYCKLCCPNVCFVVRFVLFTVKTVNHRVP